MKLVVVKYNAGNTGSVINALDRLNYKAEITADPERILAADKVIFPGVGEAATTMRFLEESGLDRLLPSLTCPFLGICLGMQLMCKGSEEGNTPTLGIFREEVLRFRGPVKVPHMGWNQISNTGSPLFKGLSQEAWVYFVHSYYAETGVDTIATCDYGGPFSAALGRENFYGVQFHPEKSGKAGLKILENFLLI